MNASTAQMIIVGVCLILILVAILVTDRLQHRVETEVIEEDNPEYLELIAVSRNNFLNELLEHLRVDFYLPTKDIAKDTIVDLVRENVNRVVVNVDNYVITALIYWSRKVKINVMVLDPVTEKSFNYNLTLRMRDNTVDWHKLHKLGQEVDAEIFSSMCEEDRFRDIVMAAKELAESSDAETLKNFLFEVSHNYPYNGEKVTPKVAAKQFAMLMSYILANYAEEYLKYLQEDEQSSFLLFYKQKVVDKTQKVYYNYNIR